MRRVVVLPAPLGPSRPVIWPSGASKSTRSTALTVRVLVLNALCRLRAMIMGGSESREWGKCRGIGDRELARQGGGADVGNRAGTGCTSRRPAIEAGDRRPVAHGVKAAAIKCRSVGRLQKLAEQLGHAADAEHVVALPAQLEMTAV